MGAATAGLNYATFGAVGLDESNRAHENTRLNIRQEALKLQRDGCLAVVRTAGPTVARTALQEEILVAICETGDPKLVEDWPAEIIAPPEE